MRRIHIWGKLHSIIKKHKYIDYTCNCIKKRKDDDFVDFTRDISSSVLRYEGKKTSSAQDRCIYYIQSGNPFSGFGAEFRRTLDALVFADYYNFEPVIEYTEKYLYSEKEPINGKCNPYEYYFIQVGNEKFLCNKNMFMYVKFREEHRRIVEQYVVDQENYYLNEDYIALIGSIIKKYVTLNDETKSYIDNSLKKIGFDSSDVIGVHFRGTDYNVGYKKHPNVVSIEDYYGEIDRLVEDNPQARIFLASDEQKTIDCFSERYPNKVIFFGDVFRSTTGEPIHFSKDNRPFHKYNLGLEILRDIVALSRADYLVCGLSQVSYCARFFKYSDKRKYKKMIILDKGIHR